MKKRQMLNHKTGKANDITQYDKIQSIRNSKNS